jgi:hypothetical protein
MHLSQRASLATAAGLLGLALALGGIAARHQDSTPAAADETRASEYFDSLAVLAEVQQPQGARGDTAVLGLGYLERLRLGLGSPFRLIDAALHDPRLSTSAGQQVAWALVARLQRGEAYVQDPAALDGIGPWTPLGVGATGAQHLALIDSVVRAASTPRVGELAVRLAYLLSNADASTARGSAELAASAAALSGDRVLAERDLADARRTAAAAHTSVLADLERRRAERTLRVEAPSLDQITPAQRTEAMREVPEVLEAIHALARVPAARQVGIDSRAGEPLGPAVADRLVRLGLRQPPVAAIAVTVRTHRDALLADQTGGRALMQSRRLLAAESVNEESLAGAYDVMAAAADSSRRGAARTLLAAAVALRPLAQNAASFATANGPSASQLRGEFGLADVSFDSDVPNAWRAPYLAQLRDGLRDMRRVLPAFSVTGLRVHIAMGGLPDSALAMHDPRTRTLDLSVYSSGGTIAHELAHDLDWQAARRLYANAGGYSTDHAMHESTGALASSIRGLAEARVLRPVLRAGAPPVAERPAEIFARSVDWLVATSLASQGRQNGFLSAAQDPVLTGYAAGTPSAVGHVGAEALLSAVSQMTYVSDSTRAAFLSEWSDGSRVDPTLLVLRVLQTRVPWSSRHEARQMSVPTPSLLNVGADACLIGEDAGRGAEARARSALLNLAVDVRARGAALHLARYFHGSAPPAWARSVEQRAPWSPDKGEAMVQRLRSGLLRELSRSDVDQGLAPAAPAIFLSSVASCSARER